MKASFTTHTIAFAPGKGPSLMHHFLWEKLPLIARAMHEKELRVRIAPEKSLAQWHLAAKKPKPFVQAQIDKLFEKQFHFGFRIAVKERGGEAEIVFLVPTSNATEFLNAHNIFFHAFMPFIQIDSTQFSVDFSNCDSHHVSISGSPRAVELFSNFARDPHLEKTLSAKKQTKKQTPKSSSKKKTTKTKKKVLGRARGKH